MGEPVPETDSGTERAWAIRHWGSLGYGTKTPFRPASVKGGERSFWSSRKRMKHAACGWWRIKVAVRAGNIPKEASRSASRLPPEKGRGMANGVPYPGCGIGLKGILFRPLKRSKPQIPFQCVLKNLRKG